MIKETRSWLSPWLDEYEDILFTGKWLLQVCCCGPGRQEISIDCCTAHSSAAGECGQWHVVSVRRKLDEQRSSGQRRPGFAAKELRRGVGRGAGDTVHRIRHVAPMYVHPHLARWGRGGVTTSRNFRQGVRQSVARLSVIDKNIGTSARFYA